MKEFLCACGKTFIGSQSYNGHRRHCKVGRSAEEISKIESADRSISIKAAQRMKQNAMQRKIDSINMWYSEGHICEFCGSPVQYPSFIGKYCSGRFCSSFCARAYASGIAKQNESSYKAYLYSNGRGAMSPYEQYIKVRLESLNVTFIWNATRPQYTDVKGHTYVLDFYFPEYKLALEYDGRMHKNTVMYDNKRDDYLRSIGIDVYRIQDYDTDMTLEQAFDEFWVWFTSKYIAV